MGLRRWFARILVGPAAELDAQAAAQRAEMLSFPARISLGDAELTIRSLEPGDRAAILDFARSLPQHDLLFLRRDITQPDQVDAWLRDVREGHYASILALSDGAVVGYATVASDRMSWTRHVAELRVAVAQPMRGSGLGRLLTEQAFGIARERGIRKMMAQMTTDQRAAIAVFRRMGFALEAVLRNQVMDRDGHLHDLQIMSLDVDVFRAKLALAQLEVEARIHEV